MLKWRSRRPLAAMAWHFSTRRPARARSMRTAPKEYDRGEREHDTCAFAFAKHPHPRMVALYAPPSAAYPRGVHVDAVLYTPLVPNGAAHNFDGEWSRRR